jgi:hypothetical protein
MGLLAKNLIKRLEDHAARCKPVLWLQNSNEMSIEIYTKKVYSDTKKNWI